MQQLKNYYHRYKTLQSDLILNMGTIMAKTKSKGLTNTFDPVLYVTAWQGERLV